MTAFFAFGALAAGIAAISLLTPGGLLEPIWRLNPRGHLALETLGVWAPVILGLACVGCACAAYGFAIRRPWGYRLGIGLLLVNLAGDLTNVVLGIEPRAIVGIPVVGVLLLYLSSKSVRRYFWPEIQGTA